MDALGLLLSDGSDSERETEPKNEASDTMPADSDAKDEDGDDIARLQELMLQLKRCKDPAEKST